MKRNIIAQNWLAKQVKLLACVCIELVRQQKQKHNPKWL